MNSDEVKKTSEEMLVKIVEYISKTGLKAKDEEELLRELACSLITSSIDIDQKETELIVELNQICLDIRNICIGGVLKYKSGDETRVKKIWRDK